MASTTPHYSPGPNAETLRPATPTSESSGGLDTAHANLDGYLNEPVRDIISRLGLTPNAAPANPANSAQSANPAPSQQVQQPQSSSGSSPGGGGSGFDPSQMIQPVTDACEAGGSSCFTTGIDPGFANDLFPLTLMGLCAEVRTVRASELLDYTNYEGDYEFEMGIGMPPEHRPLLQTPEILVFAWGATVPMIAHAAGIELDDITTTWDTWVTDHEIKTAKGVIQPGNVAAVRFTINGVFRGETRIQLEHVNRVGEGSAPDWPSGQQNDVYRVDIEGTPSIFQETAFRFTDGSGRDAAAAGCLATGLRALNAVPAVNGLPPGWVTALDLPLIPGAGTIR